MIETIDNKIPDFFLNKSYSIYRHLVLQIMIILITINVFWDVPDELILTYERFISWLFYYLVMCLIIYLNIYVFVPRFLLKNKLLVYLVSVILSILSVVIIIGILESFQDNITAVPDDANISKAILAIVSSSLSMGLLIAGTSALLLFKNRIANNRRINELESNTLKSELKHLKDQINPHFLFNMINNANVLIKKQRPEASEVLFKLEDLLRYQINDSAKETVSLTSEIHFLSDFLQLEKIRRDTFEFVISKEGDINKITLPPMLFIAFVENAVKHNPDSENVSYVNLSFKVYKNKLEFCCENSKPEIPVSTKVGGLGLKNIRRRLELLFPERHHLNIYEDKTTYKVKLELII